MCNQECFDKWRSEVMMPTPRGQPGRGCSAALQHGDMMHGALCRNVLGDSERGLGLLHSAPGGRGGEVARRLRSPIHATRTKGRRQSRSHSPAACARGPREI